MGIKGYRPHMTLVELPVGTKSRARIAAAICYDATDLDLVADLRDRADMFLVAALNQTFRPLTTWLLHCTFICTNRWFW
jgi:hypothetical protein